ncbi:MAG: hypothetical protein WB626_02270 [Bacteroidota bacterium]
MPHAIALVCVFTLLECGGGGGETVTLTLHEEGAARSVVLEGDGAAEAHRLLAGILAGADRTLRLYLDGDRVETLKRTERCVEVVYASPRTFQNPLRGRITLLRALLPLTGDLAGTETHPLVSILPGMETCAGSPLRNPSGLPLLRELEALAGGSSPR